MIDTSQIFKGISEFERDSLFLALDRHIQNLADLTGSPSEASHKRGVTLLVKNKFEAGDYVLTNEEVRLLSIATDFFIRDLITHKVNSYSDEEIDAIYVPMKKLDAVFEKFLENAKQI